jgi:hypothetical protein
MAGEKRDVRSERVWRSLLAKQERSKGGIRAFCREEGIAEWQFYEWRGKLRDVGGDGKGSGGCFVPVKLKGDDEASGPWGIEIEFGHGVTVRVRSGVNEGTLEHVMRCVWG